MGKFLEIVLPLSAVGFVGWMVWSLASPVLHSLCLLLSGN
jgi:hypothetical protein